MKEIERVPAAETREKTVKESALLVCAYDDENKFKDFHLEGAISLSAFKSKTHVDQHQEIIFYCA